MRSYWRAPVPVRRKESLRLFRSYFLHTCIFGGGSKASRTSNRVHFLVIFGSPMSDLQIALPERRLSARNSSARLNPERRRFLSQTPEVEKTIFHNPSEPRPKPDSRIFGMCDQALYYLLGIPILDKYT
jgi:hypothetical protein